MLSSIVNTLFNIMLSFLLLFHLLTFEPDIKYVYWENLDDSSKTECLNRLGSINSNHKYTATYILKSKTIFVPFDASYDIYFVDYPADDINIRALYFYCLNKICQSLPLEDCYYEYAAEQCIEFIHKDPDYVLTYLVNNEECMEKYAELIGYHVGVVFDQHLYSKRKGYNLQRSASLDVWEETKLYLWRNSSMDFEKWRPFFERIHYYAQKVCVWV